MEIKIPYGTEAAVLRLPPDVRADFLGPTETPPIKDLGDALAEALQSPVGANPLDGLLAADSTVVILVADITRSPTTQTLLPLLVSYVRDLGVAAASVTVLIARGTHRRLTKEEKRFFREGSLVGVHVEEHNCDDADRLSALLLTHRGTPVRTNIALKDADAIILLSPVSFHYFAGFGGGRKLVLPGCADRASILANHRLSLVDSNPVTIHPQCRSGNLDRNPVHEDMCETLEALHGVFGINFFGDTSGRVVFLNAGDPIESHAKACEAYRSTHLRLVEDPYDVMVLGAGGFPFDINLLQTHKALRHCAGGMNKGGTILCYAKCEEGVGSNSLESGLKAKREKFLKAAYKNYDLNNQTVVSLLDLTARFEIGMVSAMNVDLLLVGGIKPCVNTEAFLAEALEKHSANRLAVVTHGAEVLLQQKEEGSR